MQVKVYYHHTDCGGVVYYGRYLEFLEEARTEFFAAKDISIRELSAQGILFVVARQEIEYKLPAFYGDILEINSRITNISRVSIEFDHEIKNQNKLVVSSAKTVLACVDKSFKPNPIPEKIRNRLS